MYKDKFVSELSTSEVKEYYDELRQKFPLTEEQWADFNILKEKLIAFAYKILDGKTNGDVIKNMFPNIIYEEGFVYVESDTHKKVIMTVREDWWNAPYKSESEE